MKINFTDCITKPLSIKTIWNRELSDLNLSVDWERVWSNLSLTSKNLAHRLIHFKVIHRAYITPYKRFKMKLQSNLNCHICNTTSSGTFLHMFWECPVISLHVNLVLSSLLRIDWSVRKNKKQKVTYCQVWWPILEIGPLHLTHPVHTHSSE